MSEFVQNIVGTIVEKTAGDYTFAGVIVAAFKKHSGHWRYVVENDAGILHIFNGRQLHRVGRADRFATIWDLEPKE